MKNWKNRKYLLIPLNMTLLFATFKYPRFLMNASRKYIGQVSLRNLLLLSTMQAFFFASTIVGSNCLALGINPFSLFSRMKS